MGCKITKTTDKDSYNPQGGSGISSTISSYSRMIFSLSLIFLDAIFPIASIS